MYNVGGGEGERYMRYYSHISEDKARKQTVKDHLAETARRSGLFAEASEKIEWNTGRRISSCCPVSSILPFAGDSGPLYILNRSGKRMSIPYNGSCSAKRPAAHNWQKSGAM